MWKARLSELDFNGAEPASVLDAMDSGWITAGPRTEEFEKEFSRRCGTSEAVAVSNGSAALALHLMQHKRVSAIDHELYLCHIELHTARDNPRRAPKCISIHLYTKSIHGVGIKALTQEMQ